MRIFFLPFFVIAFFMEIFIYAYEFMKYANQSWLKSILG